MKESFPRNANLNYLIKTDPLKVDRSQEDPFQFTKSISQQLQSHLKGNLIWADDESVNDVH